MNIPPWFSFAACSLVTLFVIAAVVPAISVLWLACLTPSVVHNDQPFIPFVSNLLYLCKDPVVGLHLVLGNTLVYSVMSSSGQVLLSLGVALLLHSRLERSTASRRHFVRTILLSPYLLLIVVTVEVWLTLAIKGMGVPLNTQPFIDLLFLIIVSIWQFFPFALLFILAVLETTPPELELVVNLETRRYRDKFKYLLWPRVRRHVYALFALRFVWMFTKFEVAFLITDRFSATSNRTLTLPVYVHRYMRDWKSEFPYWRSATATVLMFVCEIAFIAYLYWLRRNSDDYEMTDA